MKEQLISFETAKLAKEKGFDESCLYWYGEEDTWGEKEKLKTPISLQTHKNSKSPKDTYSAPSQSLLQKWLREVYHINIGCIPAYGGYTYWINNYYDISWIRYNSYEEALKQGLHEALKLIK